MAYRKVENRPTKEELEKMYIVHQLSAEGIAKTLGVGRDTVTYWLKQQGVAIRNNAEAIKVRDAHKRRTCACPKGEKSYNWRGGRRITSAGYIDLRQPDHPRARKSGYVLEHICVWEKENGALPAGWHIHHINGNKTDNSIENLKAMPSKEHMRFIATLKEEVAKREERIAELEIQVKNLEVGLAKYKR